MRGRVWLAKSFRHPPPPPAVPLPTPASTVRRTRPSAPRPLLAVLWLPDVAASVSQGRAGARRLGHHLRRHELTRSRQRGGRGPRGPDGQSREERGAEQSGARGAGPLTVHTRPSDGCAALLDMLLLLLLLAAALRG
ncbi:hypothetical protein E2C01_066164 [Portunus trituberculatus]|uniref:Uncharacterized protein n=1 Tax=Portunus trituberculatus TaxID=210409 RepID=A0A5B7HTS5_PORTR|nr:hypothetical protein [Portunus trituberculatus]